MKALVLDTDKSLSIKTVPQPELTKGEALIQLKASALNHRELWISKGLYPGMTLPCILGADGAGKVIAVGPETDRNWLDKDVVIYPGYSWGPHETAPLKSFRVLGMPDPGTICEFIKVPIENLFYKPEHLDFSQTAALPVTYLTAWRALVYHGHINSNSKVLITGIGGGVAQAGLSIALKFGAKVFVTSSSQEKIENAQTLGAIRGVNYKDDDWHLQLKEIAGGIDIVLDSSPLATLDNYFKFLNYGGRIVAYGSTGAPKTTISISKFFLRHIQFIGTAMGSPREFGDMLDFIGLHKIVPVIHQTFPLERAIDAFHALATGKQIGKIVITH